MLNSGSVFLKYLSTAADLADHKVILGLFSTVSITSSISFSSFSERRLPTSFKSSEASIISLLASVSSFKLTVESIFSILFSELIFSSYKTLSWKRLFQKTNLVDIYQPNFMSYFKTF